MSIIKPFKAYYYNQKKVVSLADVVCPPYDIIPPSEVKKWKNKSKYNFCRVLLSDNKNKYADLEKIFNNWLEKKILIQDNSPHLYVYEQHFNYQGKQYCRRGIVGLLKVDKKSVVYPHEHTFRLAKEDRLKIMKTLKANMSPIFILSNRKIPQLHKITFNSDDLLADFYDFMGIRNVVWRINNKALIEKLIDKFSQTKLIIADGHHRFEVALRFLKEQGKYYKDANYVLAYFTDIAPAMLALPTHRIVEINSPINNLLEYLSSLGKLSKASRKEIRDIFDRPYPFSTPCIGITSLKGNWILYLKKNLISGKIKSKSYSVYACLDVFILHELIINKLKMKVASYVHSWEEILSEINNKSNRLAFLLRATSLKKVFELAEKGYKMPHKSTYFYPKLLSGLLIRKLEKKLG